jgi:hypothetical protein
MAWRYHPSNSCLIALESGGYWLVLADPVQTLIVHGDSCWLFAGSSVQ